jgi:CHAT domain-containing protein
MSGLARAFFLAGARSVLVTGWSVWDDIAARVSTETLRHARNDPGRGRAAALGTAIVQLRRDPSDPRFAHPAAWAAFMLVGDPGQTEVSQQTGERMR